MKSAARRDGSQNQGEENRPAAVCTLVILYPCASRDNARTNPIVFIRASGRRVTYICVPEPEIEVLEPMKSWRMWWAIRTRTRTNTIDNSVRLCLFDLRAR
jgi:hypothetical protein